MEIYQFTKKCWEIVKLQKKTCQKLQLIAVYIQSHTLDTILDSKQ